MKLFALLSYPAARTPRTPCLICIRASPTPQLFFSSSVLLLHANSTHLLHFHGADPLRRSMQSHNPSGGRSLSIRDHENRSDSQRSSHPDQYPAQYTPPSHSRAEQSLPYHDGEHSCHITGI